MTTKNRVIHMDDTYIHVGELVSTIRGMQGVASTFTKEGPQGEAMNYALDRLLDHIVESTGNPEFGPKEKT